MQLTVCSSAPTSRVLRSSSRGVSTENPNVQETNESSMLRLTRARSKNLFFFLRFDTRQ